jgi:hypothetical protein
MVRGLSQIRLVMVALAALGALTLRADESVPRSANHARIAKQACCAAPKSGCCCSSGRSSVALGSGTSSQAAARATAATCLALGQCECRSGDQAPASTATPNEAPQRSHRVSDQVSSLTEPASRAPRRLGYSRAPSDSSPFAITPLPNLNHNPVVDRRPARGSRSWIRVVHRLGQSRANRERLKDGTE